MNPPDPTVYRVRVRDLVEFVLRRGDLSAGRDFVRADRGPQGTRAHLARQRSRPAGYRKEVRVAHEEPGDGFVLRVQGRLDGVFEEAGGVVVEEIKTVQGAWDGEPDPLHWAQVRCYGCLHAREHGLQSLTLQLAYIHLDNGRVLEIRETRTRGELDAFFEAAVAVYWAWIRERHAWCRARDESLRRLPFPFPVYRAGQRDLAVAAYRALSRGRSLFLEAPTGIGKTMSVLFPAVKALGEGRLERLYYLTARNVGQGLAEEAAARLRAAGARLRAVTLSARERVCVRDGVPCDPQACPLARGYYDRIHAALRAALDLEEIHRPALEQVGRAHQVCPYALSLDVSEWVDAVICDYNYVFDPQVYLRRHFDETGLRAGFLVDEAHNLVDRAREMFSADLDTCELDAVRRAMGGRSRCARALGRLAAVLRELAGSGPPPADPGEFDFEPRETRAGAQPDGAVAGTRVRRALPPGLEAPLAAALETAEDWLAANQPADFRQDLLRLYFRLKNLQRTAGLYDARYATLLGAAARGGAVIRLFCLDPSGLLRDAAGRAAAAVFFSATLTPLEYYRELLGGDTSDPLLRLASPFPPENLAVCLHAGLRTDFRARAGSLGRVAKAIETFVGARPGNYLVYLPSYRYLNDLAAQFQPPHAGTEVVIQRPGMTDDGRAAFLARFQSGTPGTVVGFGVLGGIFGEGIDLVGERLIGVAIVGVGLPQLSPERNVIRDYFEEKTGDGFGYASLYPGMNRVLQAAGRVIRSERDRGAVLLVDARFAEARYRRLMPAAWEPAVVRGEDELGRILGRFWSAAGPSTGNPVGIGPGI
ncbi:MAG: ATP-dependent DNA helicase [Verrucomicrobiota bacterium]